MIREANPLDYLEIYQLGTMLHPNFVNTYNLEQLHEKEYFHILVYEENHKIIGFLIYQELADEVNIDDLFVLRKFRQKHVATNLLDMLITNTKVNTPIFLEVREDNQNAIDLYKKFGFNIIRSRKNYYSNCDAYIMERKVENE